MSILGRPINVVSGGGGASTSFEAGSDADLRVAFLEKNLAINTIRDIVQSGFSIQNMVDGIVDEYNDETGVNTGVTTASYNSASDFYAGATSTVLIHSNTNDASITFADSSTNGATVTANGNVQHDTAQFYFGTSSILFDGTGDFLSLPDNAYLTVGSNEFTCDAWIRVVNTTGVKCIMSHDNANSGAYSRSWVFYVNNAEIAFAYSTNGTSLAATVTSASTPIVANTWAHVAAVRSGNTLTLYVNGTSVASGSMSGVTLFNSTAPFMVGANTDAGSPSGGANPFNGHIDEVRFINGTAAWTAAFTPPTSAYADSENYIVQSISTTADSTPTNGRYLFIYEDVSTTAVLNTDIKGYISRDGGTTFTECTLALEGAYDSTRDIISSEDLDISAQPSGTGMIYKIETFNGKNQRLHASWLQWR